MFRSKVLAAAERNAQKCIYRGQKSLKIWGWLPVVLLFEDDYQLMLTDKNGVSNSYDKRRFSAEQHTTHKITDSHLFVY